MEMYIEGIDTTIFTKRTPHRVQYEFTDMGVIEIDGEVTPQTNSPHHLMRIDVEDYIGHDLKIHVGEPTSSTAGRYLALAFYSDEPSIGTFIPLSYVKSIGGGIHDESVEIPIGAKIALIYNRNQQIADVTILDSEAYYEI